MNRRDLFRLAGAVAVAPKAMLAAPATGDYLFFQGDKDASALPTHFVGRLEYVRELTAAGVVGPGDYFFSGYAALMSAMPGRRLLITGLGEDDEL